ncbi:MAG: FecR family protein, partial [Cyclobacteriaceae bacterium]|nr:FecR family protein [Cyclobacteriaceae bacterium]
MNNMNDHIDTIYELIAKEFEGSISHTEKEQLHSWCSASPVNQQEYEQVIKVWHAAKISDLEKDIPVFDEKEAWKKINLKIKAQEKPASPTVHLYWKWAVAASLLIVGTLIGVLSLKKNTVHFVANEASASKILPDSSSVSLAHFSSVSYKEGFEGSKREVTLRGDGFFDVTKNKEKPFIVHTPQVDIRVVGTSFYVRQDSSKNLVMVK